LKSSKQKQLLIIWQTIFKKKSKKFTNLFSKRKLDFIFLDRVRTKRAKWEGWPLLLLGSDTMPVHDNWFPLYSADHLGVSMFMYLWIYQSVYPSAGRPERRIRYLSIHVGQRVVMICVNMNIYLHMYVYVYIYINMYVYMCMYVNIHTYIYICIYIFIYIYIYMYIYIFIFI